MKRADIERVGLYGNPEKTSCAEVVRAAARLIARAGRKTLAEEVTARSAGLELETVADVAELARQVDLLLVFGGDGTMLGVARSIAGCRTPILGVNIGSLGFLTAVPSAQLEPALKLVWNGKYEYEMRALIQCAGTCAGQAVSQSALNDIVVSRGSASRLIELEVRVNGDLLSHYRCDGIIVSSPTGSTAYALAAGGAVVFPTAQVIGITPICPHTLSNRSLIVPHAAQIEITVATAKPPVILSADGQMVSEMACKDVIRIGRSRRAVCLMHLGGTSFCDTLRRKLDWKGATL